MALDEFSRKYGLVFQRLSVAALPVVGHRCLWSLYDFGVDTSVCFGKTGFQCLESLPSRSGNMSGDFGQGKSQ